MSTTTLVASHNPGRPRPHVALGNAPRAFRLRRAPALEPPFDDERDINDVFCGWAPPGADRSPVVEQQPASGSPPSIATPSGEAAHAASRYVQVCLEVLNGFRPPSHLRTLSGPVEFADVLRHLRLRRNSGWRAAGRDDSGDKSDRTGLAAGDGGGQRQRHNLTFERRPGTNDAVHGAREGAASRPVMAPSARHASQPPHAAFRLLRIRVSQPLPDKAEVVAVVAHADGVLAIALRLEVRRASWVCTVFQVI